MKQQTAKTELALFPFLPLLVFRLRPTDELWIKRTFDAMNESYPHPGNSLRNAAVGAVGQSRF